MYSPRSVSTTVNPAASIAWSSADSSETIDFDLMIFATRCFAAISSTSELMSAGVSANSTVAPRAVALRSKVSSQTSRLSSARLRIALPASRVPSKSSSSTSEARRFVDELGLQLAELALQPRVVEIGVRALLEVHRCDLHGSPGPRLARAR